MRTGYVCLVEVFFATGISAIESIFCDSTSLVLRRGLEEVGYLIAKVLALVS